MKTADLLRSDFLLMCVLGLHSFGSARRLSSHFPTVRLSAKSFTSTWLPGGSRNILVLQMLAELGQDWTVGSEAIGEELTVTLLHDHTAYVCLLFLGK